MAIVNTSRPTTSLTNTARATSAELWSTIATIWSAETRSWAQCISLLADTSRPSSSMTNTARP